jgi:hypothetical protein
MEFHNRDKVLVKLGLTQNRAVDVWLQNEYCSEMRPRKERVTRLDYCQYL